MSNKGNPPLVISPTAALRGAREYAHSTDIYEWILAGAEKAYGVPCVGAITVNFRHVSDREPVLVFQPLGVQGKTPVDAMADFQLQVGSHTAVGWIKPSANMVTKRKAYDEKNIWDSARHSEQAYELCQDIDAAPIEVVTALAVLLLNTEKPPQAGHKWFLGRLQLLRPLERANTATTRISIRRALPNGMVRLDVKACGSSVGMMLFALGKSIIKDVQSDD